MADPAYTPDHSASGQPASFDAPTASYDAELDAEPIAYTTPHRALIIAAGKLARAEQERLELEYQRRRG